MKRKDLVDLLIAVVGLTVLAVYFFSMVPSGPPEPKFLHFDPAGADNSSRLDDCFSRLTAENKKIVKQNDKFGPPDDPNVCHEATHFLNSQLRCANDPEHQNDNAVYCDKGRYLLFEEPNVTLTQMFTYLGAEVHSNIDSVMHTAKQWDKEPLYTLDEWSAYINGTKCCIEVNAPAERLALSRRNMIYASVMADALVRCIEERDPTYAQLKELKEFVQWQKIRMEECSK